MGGWNEHFLQALGWCMLNSIWQMAALWCLYLFVPYCFKASSNQKYLLGITFVFTGFGWCLATFFLFFSHPSAFPLTGIYSFIQDQQTITNILNAASITYLALIAIPACRMLYNWRFIQKIKIQGIEKAHFSHRLFAQTLSIQLGIRRNVKVYISKVVSSPITVGFLKPVILLPIAAVNNLSTQQIEAVILHELAHIRRHDYLVNLLLNVIHVILYFNPFIKAFLKQIEAERESSCDEIVLQFEYDKISYASALLQLRKTSVPTQLAMAAANKGFLLQRIEKIVGISSNNKPDTAHFAGAFIGMLMLLAVHSLVVSKKSSEALDLSWDTFSQPASLFMYPAAGKKQVVERLPLVTYSTSVHKKEIAQLDKAIPSEEIIEEQESESFGNDLVQVTYNENAQTDAAEQKKQIAATVADTRKVLEWQWKDVEKSMADALTTEEKEAAKQQYLKELAEIDWKKLETNLQKTYNLRNWTGITSVMSEAMQMVKLDSLETRYNLLLSALRYKGAETEVSIAIPDVSIQKLDTVKNELKKELQTIRKAKAKKIVRL